MLIQGNFEGVYKRSSKGVSREFQGGFKDMLRKCQVCFKKMFQECFNDVLLYNFVLAWISSQLPEQMEGLFYTYIVSIDNIIL